MSRIICLIIYLGLVLWAWQSWMSETVTVFSGYDTAEIVKQFNDVE